MSDMKEYQPDLFTLEDENGVEETFELVDVYNEDDMTYYALIPQEHGDDEEDYFVILRQDDNEADGMLVSIDDEDELDRLAEIFLQRMFPDDDDDDCFDEDCGCDCGDCDCH